MEYAWWCACDYASHQWTWSLEMGPQTEIIFAILLKCLSLISELFAAKTPSQVYLKYINLIVYRWNRPQALRGQSSNTITNYLIIACLQKSGARWSLKKSCGEFTEEAVSTNELNLEFSIAGMAYNSHGTLSISKTETLLIGYCCSPHFLFFSLFLFLLRVYCTQNLFINNCSR